MIKKILSLFLIPMFALALFSGCGKDRSVNDIKEYYSIMKSKHISEIKVENESVYKSHLFKQMAGNIFEDGITILYENELNQRLNIKSSDKIQKTIALPDELPTWCNDEEMYYRYYALMYVQQPILNAIFNYYTNWSENFYTGIKLVKEDDLNQDDLNNVYDKLVELDEQLVSFASARQKFQDDVDVLGFGNVNRSVLTTYTLAVNNLIAKSYEFVNAFKDVHVKYIWSDYSYNSKQGIGTIDQLQRMFDEANLNLAYVVYSQLKSFESSELDLCKYISPYNLGERPNEITLLNIEYGELLNAWSDISTFKLQYTTVNTIDEITDTLSAAEQNTINNFVYALKAYNQEVNVFKKIYTMVDMNKYVRVKYGIDSITFADLFNSLNEVETANLNLILNFYNIISQNYINQLFNLNSITSNIFYVATTTQTE